MPSEGTQTNVLMHLKFAISILRMVVMEKFFDEIDSYQTVPDQSQFT